MAFKDYLEEKLGSDYKQIEGETIWRCPFCYKNYDYKLYVKDSLDDTDGLWHCKRCDRRGNPAQFVMEYEEVNFPEAMDNLELYDVGIGENYFNQAEELGLTLEETLLMKVRHGDRKEEDVEQVSYTPPPLPNGFKLLSENTQNPEAYPFFNYLINVRQIPYEDIVKHNMGYVVDGQVNLPEGRTLRLLNHVVILTHNTRGEYVYWNTRSIEPNPFIKTFNAPAKETEYSKNNTVFNINLARLEKEIVLVEGVFDAVTIGNSGVAAFGKQYTNNQLELILNSILSKKQKIYVYLDRDAKDNAVKLGRKIAAKHENTYIVSPPTSLDPNDLGKDKAWEMIRNHSTKADNKGLLITKLKAIV